MSNDSHVNTSRAIAPLTVAALGVVFGDIGTSPLYAIRECFSQNAGGLATSVENIYGVLSLVFWSLIAVISIKYLIFVLNANNRGEGGSLALQSLIAQNSRLSIKSTSVQITLIIALLGSALLYGDGMLTPAISVLSAVEGLKIVTPHAENYIILITVIIISFIFLIQSHGTNRIGSFFGPIILIWFVTLGILGLRSIIETPHILSAINPYFGLSLLYRDGLHSLIILGSVFLVVTGGEAIFADMGHFGKTPIRVAWFVVVLPGLALNYFGQGALLLRDSTAIDNPFYLLTPRWGLIPLVILATLATVIASQAVISGAFSLTRQAVQLGYLPRLKILHTSENAIGQIYVPLVNAILFAGTIWLVIEFRSSSNLASAYGLAVSGTMIITTILMCFVCPRVWNWSYKKTTLIVGLLLIFDLMFIAANIIKIPDGGWVVLLIAMVIFILMTTWYSGQKLLQSRLRAGLLPIESFIREISESTNITRVSGSAIYMSRNVDNVPHALDQCVSSLKSLHEKVALLMINTQEIPVVDAADRIQLEGLGSGFYRIIAHYGFIETPNVLEVLQKAAEHGFECDLKNLTIFIGLETIIPTDAPGMAIWREKLYAFMARNATPPAEFFNIPRHHIVEIGTQVEI
jgi:KUP system potassium uptake protein